MSISEKIKSKLKQLNLMVSSPFAEDLSHHFLLSVSFNKPLWKTYYVLGVIIDSAHFSYCLVKDACPVFETSSRPGFMGV